MQENTYSSWPTYEKGGNAGQVVKVVWKAEETCSGITIGPSWEVYRDGSTNKGFDTPWVTAGDARADAVALGVPFEES